MRLRNVLNSLFTTAVLTVVMTEAYAANSDRTPQSYITIDVASKKAEIAPTMYGVFFEDINRSADGGLYAEMIFNRGFEEMNLPSGCTYAPETKRVYAPHKAVYSSPEHKRSWSIPWDIEDAYPGWMIQAAPGIQYTATIEDTKSQEPEASKSMYLTISTPGELRLVNSGFYGLAVQTGKKYDLVFYLQGHNDYKGEVVAEILTKDNKILASKKFAVKPDGKWTKYSCTLVPVQTVNDGKFALKFNSSGRVVIDYVSLFPQETFHNRKNGLRKDVAEFIADLKPAFMRWPGGCIVEGLTMENRVQWKNTIGPPEKRKGEYNLWGYHSTNGFGYHEFLQYCEDIGAKTMFVCNAGMSCDGRNGDFYEDDRIEELIQEALDAIEYAVGGTDTKWGAERAKNGHKKPFGLDYIEVGNENHSAMYTKYYNLFYDRIRAKYPDLTIITCLPMCDQLQTLKGFDMNDPHFYNFPVWYYKNTDYFDHFPRENYKVYVGEYACNMGVGSGNMEGALSEGAFMMGMERNSDLVTMTSYAPLLENTKCRMGVNLFLVQNDDVIGRTSYYVEKLFTDNRPNVNLSTEVKLGMLPDKTSPKGGIGLGTYETSAEFSNVKITVDGKEVYQSDFVNNPGEWNNAGGKWKIKDGKLIQDNPQGTETILLSDHYFDSKDMTVEFDAIKTGGREGFVLHFGAKDRANCYQMTLGSFGNAWTIFQTVREGNAFVLNEKRPTFPIQTNTPYHFKLVVKGDIFECWINGELNLTWNNAYVQRQYAIAGFDKANNEVIVKVINAEDTPMHTTLSFKNAEFMPKGKRITLAAESKFDENTFENRHKVFPVEEVIGQVAPEMQLTFKPQSMTVLRLKLKN